MNPTTEPPIPQLQPPQPQRPSTYCDRHPDGNFTGFCPSCLCERLAVLEPSTNGASSSSSSSSSSRKTSTAAAAIKAIFKPSIAAATPSSSSFLPELRRTKSFSASKNEGFFSGIFEPQRKSCDVRVRNTLCNLSTRDNGTTAAEVESRNLASSSIQRRSVLEPKEEEKETETGKPKAGEEPEEVEEEVAALEEARKPNSVEARVAEIVEEEDQGSAELVAEDLRTMKDHVDLDPNPKKSSSGRDLKDIAGSFWSAASVFSKKLQKWRRKQKLKKQREAGGGGPGGCSAPLPVEKPIGRQFRDTQSEIADYGFGRRSCDTDPRFSLDAGRISLDDPRHSFDEPRASWDGYLIGRSFAPSRMGPTMVSVMEDSPPVHHVLRTDAQIPVEEPPMNIIDEEDDGVPGGSAQTRDYYQDSSSRRRKSLDRSSSIRKTAAAVVAEIDELKSSKNARVSPATTDCFQGTKLIVGERDSRDLRDWNSSSLRDDCSEMFEIGFRDSASVIGNGDRKGLKKSSRWKAWSIWGLIHRKGGNKDENDDRSSIRGNGIERSLSGSWQDRNGDQRLAFNRRIFRSNSSVSWRNSYSLRGSFVQKNGDVNGIEVNGHGKKRRDGISLERNCSARFSPNNVENGFLRLYLNPKRGSRRGGGGGGMTTGPGTGSAGAAHSVARSTLRLY